jgi:hypothetical protein
LSAIATEDGVSIYPVTLGTASVSRLAKELTRLKAALAGSGGLLDMLALDREAPLVTRKFAVETVFVTAAALADDHEPVAAEARVTTHNTSTAAGAIDLSRVPPPLKRVLASAGKIPLRAVNS